MPAKRIAFHDFNERLWLSGGRDQAPQNGLRRAVGIAPELTRSIQSRWGSQFLFNIDALALYEYDGHRYLYDGAILYKDGVSIATGFDGTRLTFAQMPPQPGLPDYLFVIGGNRAIKIAPALVGGSAVPVNQQVTKWGIDAPPDGMTAALGTEENKSIDTFDGTSANWTGGSCTPSDDSADPYAGTGDMKLAITAGPWRARQTITLDLSVYASGVLSIETDIISLWLKCKQPEKVIWIWITFSLGSGAADYKKDYYRLVVQLVQDTNNKHTAGAQLTVTPDGDRWVQVAAAKSVWTKVGAKDLDWSDVNGIEIRGGDPADVNTSIFFDKFEMYGGYALGAGPAALLGGSQYQYYVTFGNNTTGSDSDPNGMLLAADGTFGSPDPAVVGGVAVQAVNLKHIPVSTDPQVGNRKLWRTTAINIGGLTPPAFYLDTIPDNSTTVYTDTKADIPGIPIISTPWQAAIAYLTSDYVDGGNGFYFKCSVAGTSGATIPNWNIPTTGFLGFWSPITKYLTGDWVSSGGIGYTAIMDNYNQVPASNPGVWTPLGTTPDGVGTLVWTWVGLNEVPHLGDKQMLLDNAPPQVTYGDAVGPYQGSMFWCRDSTPGRRGWAYSSPPGRPESVANQFAPTSDDDPTQKLAIFDYTLWLITTKTAFQTDGENPALSFFQVMSATGTSAPFSVVATAQRGIYYQAPDGIRMIDRAGSVLPGFDNIAPIQRNQGEENVSPFTAVIGAYCRNEIIFSDGVVSFGLQLGGSGFVWRMLGQGFNALYYERNNNEILASFGGVTDWYEHPTAYKDGGLT